MRSNTRAKRGQQRRSARDLAEMRPLKEVGGSYAVDAHAQVFFPTADRETAVSATRREVNRWARVAILRERNEVRDLRAIRKQAQHLDRFLTTFARSTGWLSPGDEAEAAADMAAGFKNRDAAIRLLVPTLECINELRLLAAELNRLGIAPPPPSHSDPLARYFVEAMATAYKAICGRKPPRSRKGPFVDLLATAWLDLGFPWPPPNTSLDVWLGQKVEAYRL